MARRAFVCGHPIAHSRSPVIHGYWLDHYGLDGRYEKIDVAPENLAVFLKSLRQQGYIGGNITLPHKEAAFNEVARRDEAAEAVGAVNTVWFENGVLCGGNTDAYGYSAHLDAVAPGWRNGRRAIVLGAGGACRAIVFALKQAGFSDIRIVNRTKPRAEALAERFEEATAHHWDSLGSLMFDADMLINTTAMGMTAKPPLDLNLKPLQDHAIVSDIVYSPLKTPLLASAEARGLTTVDGLGMLLHQAVPGFERWFGQRPAVSEALRRHIVADLEKSA